MYRSRSTCVFCPSNARATSPRVTWVLGKVILAFRYVNKFLLCWSAKAVALALYFCPFRDFLHEALNNSGRVDVEKTLRRDFIRFFYLHHYHYNVEEILFQYFYFLSWDINFRFKTREIKLSKYNKMCLVWGYCFCVINITETKRDCACFFILLFLVYVYTFIL